MAATTVVALTLGVAGCGTDEEKPADSPAAAPTTAAAAATPDVKAATTAACTEAVPLGETTAAAFKAEFSKILEVAMTGDEAKANKMEADLRAKLKAWSDKLTALAAGSIEPEVKAAFTAGAAEIVALNSPDDNTPVNTVTKKFADIAQKVKTACAA
ncbi:hypothetical protein GCM10027290_46340 [Micromonospora sonneratiae]|uniref:Lipoprotein n=1 Tax=Micromonospora sonneratiae TaxID=1184706 RepID=A0ABW3YDR2_9ACTN